MVFFKIVLLKWMRIVWIYYLNPGKILLSHIFKKCSTSKKKDILNTVPSYWTYEKC